MAKDSKPAKQFASIIQTGIKAQGLAEGHRADIEARLPAGLIDGLGADLQALGQLVPAATQVRHESKGATAGQNTALESAYALVTAVRTAIQRSGQSKDVQKRYGVGAKVNARVVKDVIAATRVIVDRVDAAPDEARAAGVLPADIDALRAAETALRAADVAQETKRASTPLSTKARNQASRRVLSAIDRIAGAGILAFASDATVRARFEALLGAGNSRARGSSSPTRGGTGGATS